MDDCSPEGYPKCCGELMTAVEYPWDDPNHYDGISEYRCMNCGYRKGRWSGRELKENESEPIFGKQKD